MFASWPRSKPLLHGSQRRDEDDAEKGLYDGIQSLPISPPTVYVEPKTAINTGHHQPQTSPLVHKGLLPVPYLPVTKSMIPSRSEPKNSIPVKDKISRWILFQLWFNTYRKFFLLCISLNLTGVIMSGLGRFPYAVDHSGAMVLGNLLCAVLMRNELFLRFLYLVAIYSLRSWAPLRIRLATTSVLQHLGGIHSGCGLSGAVWLIFKVTDIMRHRAIQHSSIVVTGVITSTLVCISVLSAFPWVRNHHHNTFEKFHRFAGWLGLAVTWVFVILGNLYDVKHGKWRSDANTLLSGQEAWFAVLITILIATPWVTLREVHPSAKVAILRFNRGMQQGLVSRISRTAIMEFHAFGIVSEGTKSPCHYMICGVQGDFTKGLISDPPKTVWTRQLKFAGIGHASAMFKKGIRVCTGTGIGSALSTCIQSPNWFLIWIGSDQERTFGPTISSLIHKHIEPERMVLWDTKKQGRRPNIILLLKETCKSFGAEVIFITSNKQGNDEMMRGCFTAGLHAFGTLWDF
ncbi:hypothetical protein NM208_g4477 [Fusarium decemcellulare]|uniref:Uncharacterized protein n=1 Tax=Fusarium decemcellulare TaxID=57161 RepID=A0ACC1SKI9_9HYPO|nr:hypothetical protein NM208_g4477 [Fusarium decemcellulare]